MLRSRAEREILRSDMIQSVLRESSRRAPDTPLACAGRCLHGWPVCETERFLCRPCVNQVPGSQKRKLESLQSTIQKGKNCTQWGKHRVARCQYGHLGERGGLVTVAAGSLTTIVAFAEVNEQRQQPPKPQRKTLRPTAMSTRLRGEAARSCRWISDLRNTDGAQNCLDSVARAFRP